MIGSTNATIVNQVADYMAGFVRKYKLPQKLLMVHQFTSDMIKNRGQIQTVPGIATAVTVDGWGGRAAKLSKYHLFARTKPGRYNGLKLFYTQDTNLMKPPRGDASASLARRDRLPVAQPGTAPSPANASRASSSVVPGCGST